MLRALITVYSVLRRHAHDSHYYLSLLCGVLSKGCHTVKCQPSRPNTPSRKDLHITTRPSLPYLDLPPVRSLKPLANKSQSIYICLRYSSILMTRYRHSTIWPAIQSDRAYDLDWVLKWHLGGQYLGISSS